MSKAALELRVLTVPDLLIARKHQHHLQLYLLYLALALAVSVRRRGRWSATVAATVDARAWPGRHGLSLSVVRDHHRVRAGLLVLPHHFSVADVVSNRQNSELRRALCFHSHQGPRVQI